MRGLWDKEEVLRYLGASHSDTALDGMIARAQEEIERASQPRQTYRLFPIQVEEGGVCWANTTTSRWMCITRILR